MRNQKKNKMNGILWEHQKIITSLKSSLFEKRCGGEQKGPRRATAPMSPVDKKTRGVDGERGYWPLQKFRGEEFDKFQPWDDRNQGTAQKGAHG